MGRSTAHKTFEATVAKMFGGVRVPLSGSNSRHQTQGDCMPDPERPEEFIPDTYFECKRVQTFAKKIDPYISILREGSVLQFEVDGDRFFLCEIRSAISLGVPVHQLHCVNLWEKHPFKTLTDVWFDAALKSKQEDKKYTVVAYRVHRRNGVFLLSDFFTLVHVVQWLRENPLTMQ